MLTHPLVICVHPETANNTVEFPPTRGLFRVDSACNDPTICDSAPETQINLSGLVVDDGRRLCIDVCLVDADLVVLLDDLGGSISIRGDYPLLVDELLSRAAPPSERTLASLPATRPGSARTEPKSK